MLLDNSINLSSEGIGAFTSFRFYNEMLDDLGNYYRSEDYNGEPPIIVMEKNLVLDPTTLPLIITLGVYLMEFHKKPLFLKLHNDLSSNEIIKFLFKSDFLYVVGNNQNPNFPIGRNIFTFDQTQVGGFSSYSEQRADHKVRIYSKNDSGTRDVKAILGEEAKRDYLIEHFTFIVTTHFDGLINDISTSLEIRTQLIDIMSELITNGIFHSKSDVYVMMFSNRFKTTCSIADSGVGLFTAMQLKESTSFYTPLSIINSLQESIQLKMSRTVQEAAFAIFETFYYSMLKKRQGLFDLVINIVLDCGGYFRIHNESVQIVVSTRMINELKVLRKIRDEIQDCHNSYAFEQLCEKKYITRMQQLSLNAKIAIIGLATGIFSRYTQDTQFSAIRIFNVKFKGLHIETEIPKSN